MRSYGDPCGLSRALDIVGERWSLLIVRELLFGPKRFTDLRAGMPAASPNVLAQRLRELEDAGVLVHCKLPPPGAVSVYELTARGRELEAAMIHLSRWGSGTPAIKGAELSNDALMLALKTMFDPQRARGIKMVLDIRLEGETFRVAVAAGRIEISRGLAEDADVLIESDGATLRSLIFGGRSFAEAERRGALGIDGQNARVRHFLQLFTQPSPR
ncbi:MAG: winged helix-turn-helix transcriptional regulator [Candidatus Baltobacteraceae bacterium]